MIQFQKGTLNKHNIKLIRNALLTGLEQEVYTEEDCQHYSNCNLTYCENYRACRELRTAIKYINSLV